MVTVRVNRLVDFVIEVFCHSESSPEVTRRISTLTAANLGVREVSIQRAVS